MPLSPARRVRWKCSFRPAITAKAAFATAFEDREGRTIEVEVTDAAFLAELDRIDLIKIDVEGFEMNVLQAIEPSLARHGPPVICELMDEHLRRADTSSLAVARYMEGLGYHPFVLKTENVGLSRQRAAISHYDAVEGEGSANCNVLWLHESRAESLPSFRPLRK